MQTQAKTSMAKKEENTTGYPKAKSAAEKGKAAMLMENKERRAELQRQIAELESLDQAPVESGSMHSELSAYQNGESCTSQAKEEDMNKTPGRKSRKSEEPAEELEYNQRGTIHLIEDEDQWSVAGSTPPP